MRTILCACMSFMVIKLLHYFIHEKFTIFYILCCRQFLLWFTGTLNLPTFCWISAWEPGYVHCVLQKLCLVRNYSKVSSNVVNIKEKLSLIQCVQSWLFFFYQQVLGSHANFILLFMLVQVGSWFWAFKRRDGGQTCSQYKGNFWVSWSWIYIFKDVHKEKWCLQLWSVALWAYSWQKSSTRSSGICWTCKSQQLFLKWMVNFKCNNQIETFAEVQMVFLCNLFISTSIHWILVF